MAASDEEYKKICQEDLEFFGPPRAGEQHISYRLDPDERPRGMDVRFIVNVVSGERAKEINARQAEAIWELLKWSRDHRQQQERDQQTGHADADRPAPQPPVNTPEGNGE